MLHSGRFQCREVQTLLALIIFLATSSCTLDNYNPARSITVKANFQKPVSNTGKILSKPSSEGSNYVPQFIDKIEMKISGYDFATHTYSEYTSTNTRIGDAKVSNEMDAGRIPYGEYDIEISAYIFNVQNTVNQEIKTHEGKVFGRTVGGIFESQIIDVNISRINSESGLTIDEQSIIDVSTGQPFVVNMERFNDIGDIPDSGKYCVAVSENGDIGIIHSLTSNAYQIHVLDSKGNLISYDEGTIIPNFSGLIPYVNLPCGFSKDKFIIPYYYTPTGAPQDEILGLKVFEDKEFKDSQKLLDNPYGINRGRLYMKSGYEKHVVAYQKIAYPRYVKFVTFDDDFNILLSNDLKPEATFCDLNCYRTALTILDENSFLISAYKGYTEPRIIARIFSMDGNPISEEVTILETGTTVAEGPISIGKSLLGDFQFVYGVYSDTTKGPYIKSFVRDETLSPVAGLEYFDLIETPDGQPYQGFGDISNSKATNPIVVWADDRNLMTGEDGNGNSYNIYYDVLNELGQTESINDNLVYYDNTLTLNNYNPNIIDPRVSVNEDGFGVIAAIQQKENYFPNEITIYLRRFLF